MRINFISAVIIALLFCPVFAFSQDYYTGQRIVGKQIKFRVSFVDSPHPAMILESMTDTLGLIDKTPVYENNGERFAEWTGERYADLDFPGLRDICKAVFSDEEIVELTEGNSHISFESAIDSKTGATMEVRFLLYSCDDILDPWLLSIPVEKFENLYRLIRDKLIWHVWPRCNNVSHLRSGGPLLQDWFF